jgi:PadR family transcriptional regulator, regulatory protein AphA
LSRDDLTFISYSVLALIGRGGASPHDLVRIVESGGRVYRAAAASQYYAEPKRLERLGYLSSSKEPGRTRERTVYQLTDAGLAALREWGKEPASFPRIAGDLTVKLIAADLIGEANVRGSILALRGELDLVRDELAAAEKRAAEIPHRTKYLLLSHRLARRVADTYEEWLDDVERELES